MNRSLNDLRRELSEIRKEDAVTYAEFMFMHEQDNEKAERMAFILRHDFAYIDKESKRMQRRIDDILGGGILATTTDVTKLERIIPMKKELARLRRELMLQMKRLMQQDEKNQ